VSNTIIEAEDLGKRYRIQHEGRESYATLRDALTNQAKGVWARLTSRDAWRLATGRIEDFWALQGVSFEVKQGETLGVIGKNGAGKTTLLKILSRITKPTTGRVRLVGRVASLLEVGTGFHPELTGRENIFLNGAILGMTKTDINKKFDAIVAFAEVEKFLDTPVKRYSSGMYVRLAFAVAAHLEPEILVVDEVLAVGDAAFQKRCLGRMGEAIKEGRTVLFVSHNMGAMASLCSKGMLLEAGRVVCSGPIQEVIAKYLARPSAGGDVDLRAVRERSGNGQARFTRVVTRNGTGSTSDTFTIGEDILIDLWLFSETVLCSARMSLNVRTADGIGVYHFVAADAGFELENIHGEASLRISIGDQRLYPGEYQVTLWLADAGYEALDYIPNAFSFTVATGGSNVTRQLACGAAVVHEVPEWSWLE
jgi:lipopolysaccharide transport system ATP-binding protein